MIQSAPQFAGHLVFLIYLSGTFPDLRLNSVSIIWGFSNGKLDPWGPGGVFDNLGNPSIYPFMIDDSAHHLDLRNSNPADPDSVKAAR